MSIQNLIPHDLETQLRNGGYTYIGMLDGKIVGLHKYMYTWGLCVGLNKEGYERRYCFELHEHAVVSLMNWDGKKHPPGPWIVCKGTYEGNVVNLLNPKEFN